MSLKQCYNDDKSKFTGEENTPKGYGYSSQGELPNTFLSGRDGIIYYSNVRKDGVRIWTKATEKTILKNQDLCQNATDDILSSFSEEIKKKIIDKKKKYTFSQDENEDWFYLISGEEEKKKILFDSLPNNIEFFKDLPDEFYPYFFSNLPSEFYNFAFFPKTLLKQEEDAYVETGLENKFGGNVPFFIEGEEWAISDNGSPMTFVGQFIDPRKTEENILLRIFISFEDDNLGECKIDHVDISKKQVFIDPPSDLKINPLYLIKSFSKHMELISLHEIMEKMKIPKIRLESIITSTKSYFGLKNSYASFEDAYENHILTPSFLIKVGGTPIYCQHASSIKDSNHTLQIVESDQIPFGWGDSGIAHIFANDDPNQTDPFYLYWDCC